MKPNGHVLTALTTFTATALAAVLLLPSGVNAAGSTFVKIQDFKSKSNSGKASVVGNRLLVGDGKGDLTVDGKVTVQGSVTASPPKITPLTLECEVIGSTTDGGAGCVMNVPAGKRFVVQTVSVVIDVNAGLTAGFYFQLNTGGTNAQISVPLIFQKRYAGNTRDTFVASSPSMTLYPDVGGSIGANFQRAGTTSFSGGAVLTGYVE